MNCTKGFLNSGIKEECLGCEACVQSCSKNAISMIEDEEGFRYPNIDACKCVNCDLCHQACPCENQPEPQSEQQVAFGGYINDSEVKEQSTSGGAFTAIVDAWCDSNYVIFGAAADGLTISHSYITDKQKLFLFRKSKYSQSIIGSSYKDTKQFLSQGKKVLFSGTPCQIAGLKAFLGSSYTENLLTVEVICEGVPSPLFIRQYDQWMQKKYNSGIASLDYRYKDIKKKKCVDHGKWDFQVMRTCLKNGRSFEQDRWFNPYWSIWLKHLMSRPSCYKCPYASVKRNADITLGDLWGVHIFAPELYDHNAGSSLIICNSQKGKDVLNIAKTVMYGHELDFEVVLKYQSPLKRNIEKNPVRETFMQDVSQMDYPSLCKKWAKRPSFKLLWQKYVWGNRQKVFIWSLFRKGR